MSLTVGFTENLGFSGPHTGSVRLSIKETNLISTIDISMKYRKEYIVIP